MGGASGSAMHGSSAGTPGFIASQPSSLPTNSSFDSLCSRIWRMVAAVSVGYSGTDTCPAIQIAQSAISHHAVFFDRMAMFEPGGRPSARRCAAMRRAWSAACAQVKSRSAPPPSGCVRHTASGAVRSQWYRRCNASASGTTSGWLIGRSARGRCRRA